MPILAAAPNQPTTGTAIRPADAASFVPSFAANFGDFLARYLRNLDHTPFCLAVPLKTSGFTLRILLKRLAAAAVFRASFTDLTARVPKYAAPAVLTAASIPMSLASLLGSSWRTELYALNPAPTSRPVAAPRSPLPMPPNLLPPPLPGLPPPPGLRRPKKSKGSTPIPFELLITRARSSLSCLKTLAKFMSIDFFTRYTGSSSVISYASFLYVSVKSFFSGWFATDFIILALTDAFLFLVGIFSFLATVLRFSIS